MNYNRLGVYVAKKGVRVQGQSLAGHMTLADERIANRTLMNNI